MDIAKYFDNINKNILLDIIKRKIKDENILWLIKEILFSQKREKGLEIGNYTSQMFANIYLNEVDQYVKHKLKIKYYCRYLDDSVLMVKTKKEAKEALKKIQIFLKEKLKIKYYFRYLDESLLMVKTKRSTKKNTNIFKRKIRTRIK